MNIGINNSDQDFGCCALINWPVGIYDKIEDSLTLVFVDFPKDFIKISGKNYSQPGKYLLLEGVMRDSFHQIVCCQKYNTSRETIRQVLREVMTKIISGFITNPEGFMEVELDITLCTEQ